MKVRHLLLVFIFSVTVFACQKSHTDDSWIQLSETAFADVSGDGATLTVDIASSDSWQAEGSSAWCIPIPSSGTSGQQVAISVNANLGVSQRTGTVVVTSGGAKKTITVTQLAGSNPSGEYHYEIPVIFHVLYKDRADELQYVSQSRLAEILSAVNRLYKDNVNSVDMNLTFTLATTDPDGKPLAAAGVEYVRWPDAYPIDCDVFMNDNTGKYVRYIWDPNRYINIMIYNFSSDPSSGYVTLGIGHIPFSTEGSTFLEGLTPTEYSYMDKKNIKFAYCVSVNSLFINAQSTSTSYNPDDVTVTTAHELGHYLGLYHSFSENEYGAFDGCVDSDYCGDTPTYNRVAYDDLYVYTAMYDRGNFTFSYLVNRQNCNGDKFVSRNIMDYLISYSDAFTDDQRSRVRHVLAYSPLIPGPKQGRTGAPVAAEGLVDLPIRTMR